MVAPAAQPIAKSEKACAMFDSSAISAVTLYFSSVSIAILDLYLFVTLMTPTLPFNKPHRQRLATSAQNVRDNPKSTIEIVTPIRPMRRTGFRPILKEVIRFMNNIDIKECKPI
jgi:hypothetical protein